MTLSVLNPAELHDPTPFGYSHLVTAPAGRLVFVAGQYGSGPDGHVVSADFGEQVELAIANLETALAAVELELRDIAQIRTYIVGLDGDKLAILGRTLSRHWRRNLPAQTLLGVAALALPDMQFEIDAIAVGR